MGLKYLNIKSAQDNVFVGLIGAYLGIDTSRVNAMKLRVRGIKDNPMRVVFELYDDDNENWQIEKGDKNRPIFDDQFSYTLHVNWDGWKTVIIPLKKFRDTNAGVGDNKWNPYQTATSGGLIQMQILFVANTPLQNYEIGIDDIKLYKDNTKFLKYYP